VEWSGVEWSGVYRAGQENETILSRRVNLRPTMS
jgi:hypothetical protein